ncbi:hypothetical protein [Actinomycetospora aeridis]|uniref:STAS domain-containing protein n=1 Tax=Actinomycetospora aeridis TaxID=3129231 RepID=A0ABU8NDN0_9PSEU
MTTDPEPSLSIIDTLWGTVVRTRSVAGLATALRLRRIVLRRVDLVVLDLWATSFAESTVVGAVADLAAGLQARGVVLRVVRSPRTPEALVASAGAPVYASLAEALGMPPSPSDPRLDGPSDRTVRSSPPGDRRSRRDGSGPVPPPPGDPARTRPAPLQVPHARRPEDT